MINGRTHQKKKLQPLMEIKFSWDLIGSVGREIWLKIAKAKYSFVDLESMWAMHSYVYFEPWFICNSEKCVSYRDIPFVCVSWVWHCVWYEIFFRLILVWMSEWYCLITCVNEWEIITVKCCLVPADKKPIDNK